MERRTWPVLDRPRAAREGPGGALRARRPSRRRTYSGRFIARGLLWMWRAPRSRSAARGRAGGRAADRSRGDGTHPTLRALGMTPRQLLALGLARAAAIGGLGAALAAALVSCSRRWRRSALRGRPSPTPASLFDGPVVGLGAGAVLFLVDARLGAGPHGGRRGAPRSLASGSRRPGARRRAAADHRSRRARRLAPSLSPASGWPSSPVAARPRYRFGRRWWRAPSRSHRSPPPSPSPEV